MLINMYLQGVFDISPDHGLILVEIADGLSVEDIKQVTGCTFQVVMTSPLLLKCEILLWLLRKITSWI